VVKPSTKQEPNVETAPVKLTKLDALKAALEGINKKYGAGSCMTMETAPDSEVVAIPTGALTLDYALGIGGLPRGRIIEIYGPEGSGKSTLAQSVVAEVQQAGGVAAYVDAEHAMDPAYTAAIGVDISKMLFSQPDSGEQALSIVEDLVKSGAVDIIVVDSVAALTPQAELDGEMGGQLPGIQARLMGQALRKLTAIVKKSNTIVIFINQLRMKIGVKFGNPETTPGGNALKFYASVRLDIRPIEKLKDKSGEVCGNRVKVKVIKNKVAPPLKVAEFEIVFGVGINKLGCLVETAIATGVLEKKGSWIAYKGENIGQGIPAAQLALQANPKMMEEIDLTVRGRMGI
jgi:recombination protein RecA